MHVYTWVLDGPTSLSGILIEGPVFGSFSPLSIGSPLPCCPSAQSPPVSRMDSRILKIMINAGQYANVMNKSGYKAM